jgi:hypothetical protein
MALSLGAGLELAADFIDVNASTIEKYVRKEKGCSFKEYREKKLSGVRLKLIQKAQLMAIEKDNVTMLIFCLKNLCGWTDKVEHGFDKDKRTILLKYNLNEEDQPVDVTPQKELSDGHSEDR